MNRDLAFHELRKIANYFAKSEPHSPVSFLLEKAIRWGYMSLPDLMEELVSGNDKVLGQINLITGISEEKADLPAYKPIVTNADNNSTGVKVSAINDKASDLNLTTSAVATAENDDNLPNEKASESDSAESAPDSEFSW